MHRFFVYFIVLGFFSCSKCNSNKPGLKIMKSTDDTYIPVSSIVEEKSGANFSLLCDLVSSNKNNTNNYYDFQVSWVKQSNDVQFWREFDKTQGTNSAKKFYSILESSSEVNKAVKYFNPLRPEDGGKYHCVSLKYGLHEVVEVIVLNAPNGKKIVYEEPNLLHDAVLCSKSMFRCANGVCIIQHYTCDGKADCKDGSDESYDTCNGDPCKDKLQCDDGRCIPTSWCCDRHHDLNCTVNNRPKCCQVLGNSYEELEYGSRPVQSTYSARYLFFSIGALCILFVIVLFLLIVSRVMVMARKTDLEYSRRRRQQQRHFELLATNGGVFRAEGEHAIDLIIDNCDATDPLFNLREDQPPPYIDVVTEVGCNEPPPPYTSREVLNERSEF